MVDWKTLSIRADCSAERLKSLWNCASRHHGNPNDCVRPSVASTSEKTMASHAARQVGLILKPLKNGYFLDYDGRRRRVYRKTIFYLRRLLSEALISSE